MKLTEREKSILREVHELGDKAAPDEIKRNLGMSDDEFLTTIKGMSRKHAGRVVCDFIVMTVGAAKEMGWM